MLKSSMKNKKGSALVISMFVMVIISMMMIYFLEKLIPVSRNVKGIENTTVAYYQALSGIEESLLFLDKSQPGIESSKTISTTVTKDYGYSIKANGSKIPLAGEGNSDYNTEWNKIGPGEPLQIVLNSSMFVSPVSDLLVAFRVPNLSNNCTSAPLNINGGASQIINWQLSGGGKSLYSNGGITADDINNSGRSVNAIPANDICNLSYGMRFVITNTDGWTFGAGTQFMFKGNGTDLNGTAGNFYDFYNAGGPFGANGLGATCSGNKCTIKLSIVNPLVTTTGISIPYLEYRYSVSSTEPDISNQVPLQYTIINAEGYSLGFKRHIRKEIKQLTTNEALDFTIFQ